MSRACVRASARTGARASAIASSTAPPPMRVPKHAGICAGSRERTARAPHSAAAECGRARDGLVRRKRGRRCESGPRGRERGRRQSRALARMRRRRPRHSRGRSTAAPAAARTIHPGSAGAIALACAARVGWEAPRIGRTRRAPVGPSARARNPQRRSLASPQCRVRRGACGARGVTARDRGHQRMRVRPRERPRPRACPRARRLARNPPHPLSSPSLAGAQHAHLERELLGLLGRGRLGGARRLRARGAARGRLGGGGARGDLRGDGERHGCRGCVWRAVCGSAPHQTANRSARAPRPRDPKKPQKY